LQPKRKRVKKSAGKPCKSLLDNTPQRYTSPQGTK
jgi:hypothetical protein